MNPRFAARLLPARADLAAEELRGRVTATHFARGEPRRVTTALLDLTSTPDPRAERATQLAYGEVFVVYEDRTDGLVWGQAALDGYVGFVDSGALATAPGPRTRLTAPWSHIYETPSARGRNLGDLPCLSEIPVAGTSGDFARLRGGGFVPRQHLAPIADWVGVAEKFAGAPYLWGGRSILGIDCSGLVQVAMLAAGRPALRDSDMQATLVGTPLATRSRLARGDLVFWKGHVGIMIDRTILLHANAHHMAVAYEPLETAISRIAAAGGGPVTGKRRP